MSSRYLVHRYKIKIYPGVFLNFFLKYYIVNIKILRCALPSSRVDDFLKEMINPNDFVMLYNVKGTLMQI